MKGVIMKDDNRESWGALDPDLLFCEDASFVMKEEASSTDNSNIDNADDSMMANKVGYDEDDLGYEDLEDKLGYNDPTDRRSSWGDLDSLIGEFHASYPSARGTTRPSLTSIPDAEKKAELSASTSSSGSSVRGTFGKSSKGSLSSKSSSKGSTAKSKNDELRRKIRQGRSASMGHGKVSACH